MLTLITETKLTRRKVRRPKPSTSPIRRALGVVAHEPQRERPAVRGRGQDLVHDAVREETNEPVSRRSDVDTFSLRVVAVDVDPQRAAIFPTYVDIEFQAST
jgi:hypothetical protein